MKQPEIIRELERIKRTIQGDLTHINRAGTPMNMCQVFKISEDNSYAFDLCDKTMEVRLQRTDINDRGFLKDAFDRLSKSEVFE